MKKRAQAGFTLVELIITLVLASVILSLGVPAFTDFLRSNRMIAVTNDIVTGIQLARSEAVKRNNNVTLCTSSDGATCSGSQNWELGWIVFDDPNANATVDNSAVLRVNPALEPGVSARITAGTATTFVSFDGDGLPRNTAGVSQTATWSICDQRGVTANGVTVARSVQLGASGRVRSSSVAGSITCPSS